MVDSKSNTLSDESSKYERLKTTFLAIIFFFVIGGYTVAKELGGSIFMNIVGKEYIPWADMVAMVVLIPAILLYAKLVDKIRRYQLLAFYSLFFGLVGLLFAYFIGHPSIGISNTDTSPYRLFGWLFYVFVAGYSPFVVSVFWAFANSITSPEEAKENYAFMVSGSKIGGMLSAGLAWQLFAWSAASNQSMFSDVMIHQIVLGVSSCMLMVVPCIVFLLMRKVPGRFLHGYEAVYQVEKKKQKTGKAETGLFTGLVLLLRYPYILGIFSMVYFYEIVAKVLSYLRLGIAQSNAVSVSGVSSFLFQTIFITHAIGFLISFFGTRMLLRSLGERICLLLIPLLTGFLLLFFMLYTTPYALMLAYVALKSINYAFSWPVRESLYIPTIKEIKFKSKSWVDAFGSKFAKTSGSFFNIVVFKLGESMVLPAYSFFFAGIVSVWFMAAFCVERCFKSINVFRCHDSSNRIRCFFLRRFFCTNPQYLFIFSCHFFKKFSCLFHLQRSF